LLRLTTPISKSPHYELVYPAMPKCNEQRTGWGWEPIFGTDV
jgi:hypothetical protein